MHTERERERETARKGRVRVRAKKTHKVNVFVSDEVVAGADVLGAAEGRHGDGVVVGDGQVVREAAVDVVGPPVPGGHHAAEEGDVAAAQQDLKAQRVSEEEKIQPNCLDSSESAEVRIF